MESTHSSPPSASDQVRSGEEITLHLRTLTSNGDLSITFPKGITVRQLKERIAEKYDYPVPRQRLIYQGRVLTDDSDVDRYSLMHGNVLHLVLRPEPQAEEPPTATSANEQPNPLGAGLGSQPSGNRRHIVARFLPLPDNMFPFIRSWLTPSDRGSLQQTSAQPDGDRGTPQSAEGGGSAPRTATGSSARDLPTSRPTGLAMHPHPIPLGSASQQGQREGPGDNTAVATYIFNIPLSSSPSTMPLSQPRAAPSGTRGEGAEATTQDVLSPQQLRSVQNRIENALGNVENLQSTLQRIRQTLADGNTNEESTSFTFNDLQSTNAELAESLREVQRALVPRTGIRPAGRRTSGPNRGGPLSLPTSLEDFLRGTPSPSGTGLHDIISMATGAPSTTERNRPDDEQRSTGDSGPPRVGTAPTSRSSVNSGNTRIIPTRSDQGNSILRIFMDLGRSGSSTANQDGPRSSDSSDQGARPTTTRPSSHSIGTSVTAIPEVPRPTLARLPTGSGQGSQNERLDTSVFQSPAEGLAHYLSLHTLRNVALGQALGASRNHDSASAMVSTLGLDRAEFPFLNDLLSRTFSHLTVSETLGVLLRREPVALQEVYHILSDSVRALTRQLSHSTSDHTQDHHVGAPGSSSTGSDTSQVDTPVNDYNRLADHITEEIITALRLNECWDRLICHREILPSTTSDQSEQNTAQVDARLVRCLAITHTVIRVFVGDLIAHLTLLPRWQASTEARSSSDSSAGFTEAEQRFHHYLLTWFPQLIHVWMLCMVKQDLGIALSSVQSFTTFMELIAPLHSNIDVAATNAPTNPADLIRILLCECIERMLLGMFSLDTSYSETAKRTTAASIASAYADNAMSYRNFYQQFQTLAETCNLSPSLDNQPTYYTHYAQSLEQSHHLLTRYEQFWHAQLAKTHHAAKGKQPVMANSSVTESSPPVSVEQPSTSSTGSSDHNGRTNQRGQGHRPSFGTSPDKKRPKWN
ncbi:Large proline-rich protein bag6 [Dispira parvispora]|uniref:Large proline-rich protein bag6 n=1 Tax=Dispira parvispora TaxID=1520584 RepID=A0A9W8ALZ6_9FUNG|nr:Large proline-rich protein bag6 [Dispira parvispora]